jgi:hypothetical protein
MTTLNEIKQELDRCTHASQYGRVVAMLLGYLQESGVQTPAEKEQAVNEQRHQQVAQASTTEELDEVVKGWGADFKPDDDLVRAVDERDAYLAGQAVDAVDEASGAAGDESAAVETGDYTSWDKNRLAKQARTRGLPVSGTKDELADRLAKDDQKRQDETASDAGSGDQQPPTL